MFPTVALTGASGFIGGALAHHLCQNGWHVRALVRSPQKSQALLKLGIKLVQGSLENPSSLRALVQDCQGIIHCAGTIRGIRRVDFQSTNVEGVSHLLKASLEQSLPPYFILLSSLAAREPQLSPYAWSKREGEKTLVREAGPVKWVIFRLPAVYGPKDKALRPLFNLLRKGIGLQLGTNQGKFSLLHVDDLAQVVMHWLEEKGPPFKTFEVGDGYSGGYTWDKVFRVANPSLRIHLRIPPKLLRFLAFSNEILSRVFQYSPLFTTGKVAELLHPNWVCDNTTVTQELGWTPQVPLHEGLRRLFTSDRLKSRIDS